MTKVELRSHLIKYFEELDADETAEIRDGRVAWRTMCFDLGLEYADFVEQKYFPLKDRVVIDVACAWGGHSLAFASRGAEVIGSDLNEHAFARLNKFAKQAEQSACYLVADCQAMPYADSSADVILGIELVEHIFDIDQFASEVARVLKPGGVCLITTPSRLWSILGREPHFGLRGLALLPFSMQPFVARKIFGKGYSYPITQQYSRVSQVTSKFRQFGLHSDSETAERLKQLTNSNRWLRRFCEKYLWRFILITKP